MSAGWSWNGPKTDLQTDGLRWSRKVVGEMYFSGLLRVAGRSNGLPEASEYCQSASFPHKKHSNYSAKSVNPDIIKS
jgi:hypothetical protein